MDGVRREPPGHPRARPDRASTDTVLVVATHGRGMRAIDVGPVNRKPERMRRMVEEQPDGRIQAQQLPRSFLLAPDCRNLRRSLAMTYSLPRISLVVFLLFSAVALCSPQAAIAQSGAPEIAAAPSLTPPPDAKTTDSGLAYVVATPGTGTVKPTDADLVKVATSFWYKDSKDGKPGTFGVPTRPMDVGQILLPGLREGLKLMTAGQKMRFWRSEKLAFAGAAGKPAGPLVVEVVLLDVIHPPAVPADVAAPPADAIKTKSGLASKVLKPGTGTTHPKSSSTVTVQYSGWTPDGKRFDSSVIRGQAASFPLDKVIAGWTEGVQLMVPGEARRFWIPGKLAYDGSDRPDAPKGMLVFDIELIAIDGKQ